jgi:hypothetical protein
MNGNIKNRVENLENAKKVNSVKIGFAFIDNQEGIVKIESEGTEKTFNIKDTEGIEKYINENNFFRPLVEINIIPDENDPD